MSGSRQFNEIRTLQDVADRLDQIEFDREDTVFSPSIERLKLDVEIAIRRDADAKLAEKAADRAA